MRAIAKFLDIEFERSMLSPTFNRMPVASDSSFEPKYGIDPTSLDRSETVEPEVRAYVRQRTASVYPSLQKLAADDLKRWTSAPFDGPA